MNTICEQIINLSWLDTPVTFNIIENYTHMLGSIIQVCTPHVDKLKTLRANKRQLAEDVKRYQEAISLIDELARLAESQIEIRASRLTKQCDLIANYSILTAKVDKETLGLVATIDENTSVDGYLKYAATIHKRAEEAFLTARHEYDEFAKLRDRSLSLQQELRSVATQILEDRPSDVCPLCHTKFQAGELANRIVLGVDEHFETKAQKLLENLQRGKAAVSDADAIEKAADQISSLCIHLERNPLKTALKDLILSLDKAKDDLAEAQKRRGLLESEIRGLEAQGLSLSRLNEIRNRLKPLVGNLHYRAQTNISSVRSDVEKSLKNLERQINAKENEEARLHNVINEATGDIGLEEANPMDAMAELNERLAATCAVFTAMNRFSPHFEWEGSRPVKELMVEVDTARMIAVQLQAALEKERIAANTQLDASQRRNELEPQERELAGRVTRLSEAQKALTEIQEKHSLRTMTESALEANHGFIEAIFAQIHSPAEFKAIGNNLTLIRKLDDRETSLTQVSTGQRAAFALSVFIAQNAQLRAGPRVALIDDPIAHVDDLNCLSFLDYLREIALTGTRQIFFATASDKLASLFERKFDFLGERFKRFNLTRDIEDGVTF